MIELDHISLGVRNLYEAEIRLRNESGLDSCEGGYVPAIGLGHRVVPLPESTYIEIESIIDHEEGVNTPVGKWFVDATRESDAWMFWCLRTSTMEELEQIAERLGTGIGELRPPRVLPNGRELGILKLTSTPGGFGRGLPNWYCWGDISHHPSKEPVEHRRSFTNIAWLEVGGDPAEMEAHVTPEVFERLPLRFVDQPGGLYALALGTDDGEEVVVRRPSAASTSPL